MIRKYKESELNKIVKYKFDNIDFWSLFFITFVLCYLSIWNLHSGEYQTILYFMPLLLWGLTFVCIFFDDKKRIITYEEKINKGGKK